MQRGEQMPTNDPLPPVDGSPIDRAARPAMNSDLYYSHLARVLELWGAVARLAVKDVRHPSRIKESEHLIAIDFLERCGLMEQGQIDRRVPPCSCRHCRVKRPR